MAVSDEEIDRLFQLPPDEFTPARNALAKGAGADAAAIKRLHRPHAAAWAVNQLYWQRRKAYDRLIAASERLRAAHAGLLSGQRVDLSKVEQEYRDALKAAMDDIRGLVADAGEKPTAATLTAANETLQALPHPTETAGRLVRPLKPLGFEALSSLLGGAPGVPRRMAEVVPFDRSRARVPEEPPAVGARTRKEETAERRREEKARAREAEARRRETARLEKEVGEARARDREAQKTLTHARQAVERAEGERDKAEAALKAAADELKRLQKALEQQELEAANASTTLARLQRELQQLV
jgi:chromosome segregation ATPase